MSASATASLAHRGCAPGMTSSVISDVFRVARRGDGHRVSGLDDMARAEHHLADENDVDTAGQPIAQSWQDLVQRLCRPWPASADPTRE